MKKVFISYRREDTQPVAGRLFDGLEERLGKGSVFFDIDSIPPGTDFRQHVRAALDECGVLLVLIGRQWLETPQAGKRRLDHPQDLVRVEIEVALDRGMAVIPVLVDQANMPAKEQLPGTIAPLTDLNAVRLDSGIDFRNHLNRLVAGIAAHAGRQGEGVPASGVQIDDAAGTHAGHPPGAARIAEATQAKLSRGATSTRTRRLRWVVGSLSALAAVSVLVYLSSFARLDRANDGAAWIVPGGVAPAAAPASGPPTPTTASHPPLSLAAAAAAKRLFASAETALRFRASSTPTPQLVADLPSSANEHQRLGPKGKGDPGTPAAVRTAERDPVWAAVDQAMEECCGWLEGWNLHSLPHDRPLTRSLVLIGTVTDQSESTRTPGAVSLCFALADLSTNEVLAREVAWATLAKRDHPVNTVLFGFTTIDAPSRIFGSSEESKLACGNARPGEALGRAYLKRVEGIFLLRDAQMAYEGQRYETALKLYKQTLGSPGVDQNMTLTRIYLSSMHLGNQEEMTRYFSRIVASGLERGRLPFKLLFEPGSTRFLSSPSAGAYSLWVREIASQMAEKQRCIELIGHSGAGENDADDSLSLRRAQFVKGLLEAETPQVGTRVMTTGKGSREALIGLGSNDLRDAVDRRVEMKVIPCK